ncbi:fibronectin type III domain-containing protein [Mycetocola zhujimingii]|uniref:fibronectin type III domain-containing protein n=1 Tax=Mycetocola zhujimingii TaxID=2079792 RepID=UPI000D392D53|nr:fibronectin type III domain-containing protein [Mycetocola zhujimingii]AWB87444.1 hypothetical protein C3E77_13075 [Mycetocola zhujimingii]
MPASAPARPSRLRRARSTKGTLSLVVCVAIVAVVTLLSTGSSAGTYASLSDTSASDLPAVSAGSITAASTFGIVPTVSYTSSVTEKVGNLMVSNNGTVGATYTTTLTRTGSAPLASAVRVVLWKSTAVAGCTTPVSPITGTWASLPVLTGTLSAGASQFYCIKTTLTSATGVTANSSVTATFTTVLNQSSWTSAASSAVTQTFVSSADTTKPTAPTALAANAKSATSVVLTWKAATDAIGVKEYLVYRGTTLVSTVASPTLTYTDNGTAPSTAYSYTVRAKDAAGNTSDASNVASVTTPQALRCASTGDPAGYYVNYTWNNTVKGDASVSKYLLYVNGSSTAAASVGNWETAIGVAPDPVHATAPSGSTVPVVLKQKLTNGQEVIIATGSVRLAVDQWGSKRIFCA